MNGSRKLILFAAIIVAPAIIIGVCNYRVFPDALFEALGMLLIAVVVSGVFTWQSRLATPKIERYCTIAAGLISIAFCVNLGGHWLLARESSAARQGVEESNAEADRAEKRRAAEVARELMLTQAEIERAHAERLKINADTRRLDRLPVERRRMAIATPRLTQDQREGPRPAPSVPVSIEAQAKPQAPRLTPAEVLAKWAWFLTVMAFVDCFLSVFSGGILFALWEWDKNRNGIPDHLEIVSITHAPQAQAVAPLGLPASVEIHKESNGAGLGKKRPSW